MNFNLFNDENTAFLARRIDQALDKVHREIGLRQIFESKNDHERMRMKVITDGKIQCSAEDLALMIMNTVQACIPAHAVRVRFIEVQDLRDEQSRDDDTDPSVITVLELVCVALHDQARRIRVSQFSIHKLDTYFADLSTEILTAPNGVLFMVYDFRPDIAKDRPVEVMRLTAYTGRPKPVMHIGVAAVRAMIRNTFNK